MLIGRRNYLRIVHAGFVCRNGGFHVLFRAVGTDFPRQNNERYRSANMAVARRLGKSLLFTLSPNWL